MNILVLQGSSREGRLSDRVARWVQARLAEKSELTIDFVDIRELNLPMFDEVAPPSGLNGHFKSEAAAAWNERLKQADGFIFITGEYNHGIPAVLKNAIDYAWEGWNYKPLSIVSYSNGMMAGARATEQLRLVAQGVKLLPLYSAVHIPRAQDNLAEDGTAQADWLNEAFEKLIAELTMIAQKLKT